MFGRLFIDARYKSFVIYQDLIFVSLEFVFLDVMLFVEISLEHLCLFVNHFVSKLLLVCCLGPFYVGIGWLSRWHNPLYALRVQLLLARLSRTTVCKHFDCHGHTLQG